MASPLAIAYAIVFADLLLYSLKIPPREVVRLLLRLTLYALLSGVLFIGGLDPFSPAPDLGAPALHAAGQVVEIVWWLTGARLLALSLDKLLLPRAWREQRLFQDVFGAVVFLAAVVAALGFVLALPIRGLVATSGALAIVLGLAVQSTLSDVFAGIVLNTTEPYHVGDWVAIDDVEGKVVEMNWRATHLVNGQGNIVIVPNAVAAKAKITNNNRPPAMHGIVLTLDISPEYRPKQVLDALLRAAAGCRALLGTPAPYAHIKSTGNNAICYEIVGFVDDMGKKTAVSNDLFDLCFRHLGAAGVRMRPLNAPALHIDATASPMPEDDDDQLRLLQHVDMFRAVPHDKLEQLATQMTRRELAMGDTVVEPQTVMESLSVVASGVLSVAIDEDNRAAPRSREIARFGPGDTFGESGLLASSAAGVRVTALTPSVLFVLDKKDFLPFMQDQPEVANQLCMLLSRRQDALGKLTESAPVSETAAHSAFQWFMEKVHLHTPRP